MQSNFMMWLGGLDSKNRERLSRNITIPLDRVYSASREAE